MSSDDDYNYSDEERDEEKKEEEEDKKPQDSNNGDDDGDQPQLSRKERKKLEAQKAFAAELEELQKQAGNPRQGDSPWAVAYEQDAIHEGSRNVVFNGVNISINGKTLFKETQVKFSAGFRYAMCGPNGRGKSSLLTLLDTRELPVQQSMSVMLVQQEQELDAGELTPVQAVLRSHKQLEAYEKEAEALRNKAELTDAEMKRLQFIETELQLMGADQSESKARKILHGLGFPFEWQDRPTSSFSGGWRKRIALASAVFIEPDMLMLDEPTNHLDLNAVIWLETYLSVMYSENARRPKILIVVSHDAGFLDGICTHVVHIENFKLHYYRGNFSQFENQLDQAHNEADKKHAQLTRIVNQKKREGMSNKDVNDWLKEQVRVGKVDPDFLERRREYTVTFPLKDPPELRDGCVVKLEEVEFNYPGGPTLFKGVSTALWTDSRICVCGPNGIGKSTLISLLTGEREPVAGHANINRQVRIGRYTQHFVDKIPLEKTPVEYLITLGLRDEFEARALLGQFGLEGICHHQMCASLSGGQKARVALAAVSVPIPHFILFDEPTNHLDLESIEALCSAINNFKGGVMVVTHDARLIERTSLRLWLVGDLNVKPFDGDLDDYKEMIRKDFHELEAAREAERDQKAAEKKLLRKFGSESAAAEAMAEAAEVKAAEADDFFATADAAKAAKKPPAKSGGKKVVVKKVVVVKKGEGKK